MLYVAFVKKMLRTHTTLFGFTDVWKYYGKFQLFNMCVSQDIVKASLHQISFKLKCF